MPTLVDTFNLQNNYLDDNGPWMRIILQAVFSV